MRHRTTALLVSATAAACMLLVATPASAAITPTKDANQVAGAISDNVPAGMSSGAGLPNIGIPRCSDGADNDGNYKADFPDDPNCTSAEDNQENPGLGNSGSVPECQNGVDDDSDGALIEFVPSKTNS